MPPVIYAFATVKGGTGKTTAAVHLAAALAEKRDARVVLVDGDTHTHAATGWAHRGVGRLPFEVRPAGADTDDVTAVVIDAAGGEAAADLRDLADRLIIPSVPSALDLLAALSTYRTLPEGARPAVLLTRGARRRRKRMRPRPPCCSPTTACRSCAPRCPNARRTPPPPSKA